MWPNIHYLKGKLKVYQMYVCKLSIIIHIIIYLYVLYSVYVAAIDHKMSAYSIVY